MRIGGNILFGVPWVHKSGFYQLFVSYAELESKQSINFDEITPYELTMLE